MDVRVHRQVSPNKPAEEFHCSGFGAFFKVRCKVPIGIFDGVAKWSKAPVRNTDIVGSNPTAAFPTPEKYVFTTIDNLGIFHIIYSLLWMR